MEVFLEIAKNVDRFDLPKYMEQTSTSGGVEYFVFSSQKGVLFIETNNPKFKNRVENLDRLKKLIELWHD